jgi:ribosomal protein S1
MPSRYEVGQSVTVRVERVYPFGVFVRLPDGTPGYVRWRDLTRGGHWDPAKLVAVGQEAQAVVVELPVDGRVLEVSLRQVGPAGRRRESRT